MTPKQLAQIQAYMQGLDKEGETVTFPVDAVVRTEKNPCASEEYLEAGAVLEQAKKDVVHACMEGSDEDITRANENLADAILRKCEARDGLLASKKS